VYSDGFAGPPVASGSRTASGGTVLLALSRWRHKLRLTDHQSGLIPVPVMKHRLTTGHLAGSLLFASVNQPSHIHVSTHRHWQ